MSCFYSQENHTLLIGLFLRLQPIILKKKKKSPTYKTWNKACLLLSVVVCCPIYGKVCLLEMNLNLKLTFIFIVVAKHRFRSTP